ncbi:type II toxin-antitoxin system HicB family antitoxin [Paenibacillus lentus]|uniref:HicB-like antitoxin of toxin-antitoxin system domain-containing protein n=1 Tax=Paenibacillus lentus TaxID=1338368 RepID=A0A3Q8SAK0_9BACL|nr:type II toxin-antitoxin system HicB family antitoxin [Paenibacillus lentus]AZK46265.1 hypothetical protein EIM92_08810 [Paenibacillus lentus]
MLSICFPDLPGAITCGENDEEALYMAEDCLALHLYGMEEDGDEIPESSRDKLKTNKPLFPIGSGLLVS